MRLLLDNNLSAKLVALLPEAMAALLKLPYKCRTVCHGGNDA